MSTLRQKLLGLAVAGPLFLLMAYAVSQSAPWFEEGTGTEDIDAIVQDLFTDHVIALEVLGVLLTAAMIGALVIARPLVSGLDSDHYPKVDDDTLERTQEVSAAGARFTVVPLPPTPITAPTDVREATGTLGGEEE